MVEIADIKDRDSLKAWLETQPHKTSVAIAQRAAMRVLPVYWGWILFSKEAPRLGLTGMSTLRENFVSNALVNCPNSQKKLALQRVCIGTEVTAKATAVSNPNNAAYAAAFAATASMATKKEIVFESSSA